MLQLLVARGELDVSGVARLMDCSLGTASQSLRMLNARGLLNVRRNGRHVFYRAGGDRSLPESALLLQAVVSALGKSGASIDALLKTLTAATHPRRQQILKWLRRPMRYGDLKARMRVSSAALTRHLQKLRARAFLDTKSGWYRLAWPADDLRKALLALAAR